MNLLQYLLKTWWIFWTTDEWQLVASDWQIMRSSAMRGCIIRCIFTQLSHFYMPYTPSAGHVSLPCIIQLCTQLLYNFPHER